MGSLVFLAETSANQDLVSIIPWTIIAQLCNLLITMLLMKRFLLKPVREVLEKRKEKADAEIKTAEAAKAEALDMKAAYEKDMQQARDKANDILATAQKNAATRSDEIIREANAQAVAIKAKAEQDIAQERRKAVNEIKDEIGDMAMEIAGKVIEREVNKDDHKQLVNDFIEKVGDKS